METLKKYINHPMSKVVACGILGSMLLVHGHLLYSGMVFGVGIREFLLALK